MADCPCWPSLSIPPNLLIYYIDSSTEPAFSFLIYVCDPLLEDRKSYAVLNEQQWVVICTLIFILTLFKLTKMQVC